MSVEAGLRLAIAGLEQFGIPYMVTGSLASAFYGEPRSTQDLDIVVNAEEEKLQKLGAQLRAAGLYCAPEAITEAVSVSGMFNAIDPSTGWKIDFIVLKPSTFHRSAFEARSLSELSGVRLHLIRAEDIVVAKLSWAKMGGSERQLRDVLGVLMVQGVDCSSECCAVPFDRPRGLEKVPRRHSRILEDFGLIQLVKLAPRDTPEVGGTRLAGPLRVRSAEYILGSRVLVGGRAPRARVPSDGPFPPPRSGSQPDPRIPSRWRWTPSRGRQPRTRVNGDHTEGYAAFIKPVSPIQ